MVGITGKVNLCTAPSLIGLDISGVPEARRNEIQGDLFMLPEIVKTASDCPESWILNVEAVKLWAKEQAYDTHGVNYFRMPDGDMVVNLPGKKIVITAPDVLGETSLNGEKMKMQKAFDKVFVYLRDLHPDSKYIWDVKSMRKWGCKQASEAQKRLIERRLPEFNAENLTKQQASQIIQRITHTSGGKKECEEALSLKIR